MRVAFHTLGCKVNQYETEMMSREFRGAGYQVVDEREPADVYVVNSCTVTAMADRKSRQFVRRMKKQNPDSVVVMAGCYGQIDPEAAAAVEGVDILVGTAGKDKIPGYVEQFLEDRTPQIHVKGFQELDAYEESGLVCGAETRTRAYIKIQEGCNRFCSYCVIPYARGRIRSRDLDQIVEEAKALIASGYKEIVLTGINTALYDMEGGHREGIYGVEKVIAALNELDGDFRIRLSSLEPAVVNADYVRRLMKYEKLCHHVHLSAQSGSSKVLKAMNRPYDREQYLEIVKVLREFDPLYGISTDLIVGFPGEGDEDFEESISLTEACDFVRTHVFKYSRRPFTKAASLDGQVSPQIKKARSVRLQTAGEAAARRFCEKNVGQQAKILVETWDPVSSQLTGYSDNYIKIYVNQIDEEKFHQYENTFLSVKLTEVYQDGMLGVILDA